MAQPSNMAQSSASPSSSLLQTAISRYAEQLQDDPESYIFMALANALRKKGMVGAAIKVCEEGIWRHPHYHTARVVLGQLYAQVNRIDEALGQVELALRDNPDNLLASRLRKQLLERSTAAAPPDSEPQAATESRAKETASPRQAALPYPGRVAGNVPTGRRETARPPQRRAGAPRVKPAGDRAQATAPGMAAADAEGRRGDRATRAARPAPAARNHQPHADVVAVLESWLAVLAERKSLAS